MFLALFSRLLARRLLAFCAVLSVTAVTVLAQTPSAADGFDPDVDGNVFVMAVQPDGRVVIGGQFSAVRGVPRNHLARLNADGSLDEAYNPNPNGPVRAIVLQPENRIVVGGDFTALQPNATGATVNRGRIARINADGTVDAFNPNVGGTLLPQVFALALQPNGQIVAGGTFTTAQPTGLAVPATRNYLARFNADGSLDASYNPNPNAMVLSLAYHVDNKIVVGGGFTTFQAAGESSPTTRNRIARLNPNGTIDSEFNPNANNGVTTLAVQRDGKILLGGFFTTLQPVGDATPANRVHIARLNVNGTLDSEFYPRVEGNVSAITVQPDGGILVGGNFNSVWGRGSTATARNNLARFNPDGTVDVDFAPLLNGTVDAFATQPDGKLIIGGHFTRGLPQGSVTPLTRNHLARLNVDGSFDASFELNSGGRILSSVTQADGKVVIGGTFTSVGGASHNYVARLNADGTVDPAYNPDFNGRVYTLAYEASSGKVIVGGAFTTIGGETRNHIARLNPSGTIDSEFNPNIDGQVGVVVLQPDGRILVGGTFSNVQPIGAATTTPRSNLLRLNSNGTLDTAFDPSPNSSISAIAVQSDAKVLIGGLFSALSPGFATNTSATITARNFFARLNADGTLDTPYAPNPNGQVSTIAVQSDNKVVIGGAFTGLAPVGATELTTRNRIARINADGTIDTAYNPNANGNVLTSALQSDGKLLIGGSFTTLQPGSEALFTLRKYAARLNADGTVDSTYNLDLSEGGGNRVDSLRIQTDGRVFIGGAFTSLQPLGSPTRTERNNFARLTAAGLVDTGFNPNAGGSTGAIVNAFAVQPDGRVIAVGSFADLGGAKSTNIARFFPEGTADAAFSNTLTTDGPVNAVVVRPNGAPVPTQTPGFAWLNSNGTLRPSFSTATRLSGEVNAIAVDAQGRILLGGSFANVSNTTGGNLVRFNADGTLDTSFNPQPNGAVTGIAIQNDGRIVAVGAFTTVGGVIRNHIARIDANGSLDVTFDPNASARINAVVIQSDGLIVVGGAFTTFAPNGTTTAVARSYLARINVDGTIDPNYNPTPNVNVNALAIQGDGKVIAGGSFTSVQPNLGVTAFTRNGIARFNSDGTLDQNFNPNVNAPVNALAPLANGQIVMGGAFTTVQPNQTGTVFTRNNIARINSDGAVDATFNPSTNGPVLSLALQPDGGVIVGGVFTTLQPGGTGAAVTRHNLARVNADGSLDVNFNPDINGRVGALVGRADGSVLSGGNFTELQLNGSIFVGGSFATLGGVPARNLGALNDDGSVNTAFQPRPDGVVNALLVLGDGRVLAGGGFTNIANAPRNRLARFNADSALDVAFNPNVNGTVSALAVQSDGKYLVGGTFSSIGGQARTNLARLNVDGSVDAAFPAGSGGPLGAVTGLAVQPDGNILVLTAGSGVRSIVLRLNADGSVDSGFTSVNAGAAVIRTIALQADGRILLAGDFTSIGGASVARLARLNANGAVDPSFNPGVDGPVTAVALQPDGRVMLGGSFSNVGGRTRVGIARLAATNAAVQLLGVTANRSTVIWNRAGTTGEVSGVIFEISSDRVTWTKLGDGTRVPNSGADWQLTGVSLPASGSFYLRARGLAQSTSGTSSGIFESVREFNFANPVIGVPTTIAQDYTPNTAALVLDPVTGIAPRSTILMVPGEGAVEIVAATAPDASAVNSVRLTNLSTRGRVSAENPLILGFAIAGTEPRTVLVRAVGPALAGFGVSETLPATRLQVYDATGAVIAANEGWAGAANLVQAAAATGAFPLNAGSADSAALLTLSPGTYTLQVGDPRGSGGVGLAEIYDAGTEGGSRLVNVSSRGAAGSGNAALISGFVIAGTGTSERVLLRGIGPGLTKFGATGVVTDPSVALFDAEGRALGANDNWVSSLPTIPSATTRAGAFALDVGSRDAAILATLPTGAYTIQVSAGSTGTALLEIYEVR